MTRQVAVAVASSFPVSADVSLASAVACLRPRWTTSAAAWTTPVSLVIGRTNFVSSESVV